MVVYLNRLSDLLFVLSRAVNHLADRGDVPWQQAL
jgi:cob(I)alamin adenosyltransferase